MCKVRQGLFWHVAFSFSWSFGWRETLNEFVLVSLGLCKCFAVGIHEALAWQQTGAAPRATCPVRESEPKRLPNWANEQRLCLARKSFSPRQQQRQIYRVNTAGFRFVVAATAAATATATGCWLLAIGLLFDLAKMSNAKDAAAAAVVDVECNCQWLAVRCHKSEICLRAGNNLLCQWNVLFSSISTAVRIWSSFGIFLVF